MRYSEEVLTLYVQCFSFHSYFTPECRVCPLIRTEYLDLYVIPYLTSDLKETLTRSVGAAGFESGEINDRFGVGSLRR